ncbi:MAG: Mur ligase family protein [Patescibacteria group bacterium]
MRPITTYNQAVAALLSLNNLPVKQYLKDPRQCDIYLKRLQWLLDHLGNPEKKLRFIHIAGTSGKGSVTTMLHEILRAAGYRVGSYTSPYVAAFTDRWHLDGKLISPDDLVTHTNTALEAVELSLVESPHGPPSYFETLMALAFVYFNHKKCDWVVLETGCGGDFDASNVIPAPRLAIITNIGLDHTEILGKTRSAIAKRKAGIFKAGSVAIIGEPNPEIAAQLAACAKEARMKQVIRVPRPHHVAVDDRGTQFTHRNKQWHARMVGTFQAENAAVAIEAARALRIGEAHIDRGLREARIAGRFEIMQESPTVILDGAHNQDKMDALLATLHRVYPKRPVSCLVAATNNAGKATMFDGLFRGAQDIAATRFTTEHRPALNPRILAARAKELNPRANVRAFLFPRDGLRWLIQQATRNEIILVTGSLFLVSDMRGIWMPESRIVEKQRAFV